MRKIVLPFVVFVSSLVFVNAQETESENTDYNKWSVEVNGGLSKPTKPFTGGYYVGTFEFNSLHGDLGVRYMLNPKFGLKADFGYDKLENADNSATFETSYIRFNLQGVVNIGRVLNFEDWTNTLGLLGHAGIGYGMIKGDNLSGNEFTDKVGVFMAGLTGQVKISDRFVLNADFTAINNMEQNKTWDGKSSLSSRRRGFEKNFIYNATVGFTVYLGSNVRHADWVVITQVDDELNDLEKRIAELENMLMDSDKDGVPDYLDMEPNSTPGVAVDSKGRAIDNNGNGIPDELEGYLESKYGVDAMKSALAESKDNNQLVKEFINGGYVTTYFDFNKDQPTNVSSHGIDFIRTYLLNNPSASVDIFGHADEIGNAEYNYDLANRRAQNVKNILVKAGISEDRLNVVSKGEDNSVEPSSAGARKLVRRVTFQIRQ